MKKHLEENHRLPLALLLLLAIITLLASFYAGSRTAGVFTFSPRAAFEGPFMGESLGNPPGTPDLIGESGNASSQKYCMGCNSEKGYCESRKVDADITCLYTTSLADRIVCNASCVKSHIAAISGLSGTENTPSCDKDICLQDDPKNPGKKILKGEACSKEECKGCDGCPPQGTDDDYCFTCSGEGEDAACVLSDEKKPCLKKDLFDSCENTSKCKVIKDQPRMCSICENDQCKVVNAKFSSNISCHQQLGSEYYEGDSCDNKCKKKTDLCGDEDMPAQEVGKICICSGKDDEAKITCHKVDESGDECEKAKKEKPDCPDKKPPICIDKDGKGNYDWTCNREYTREPEVDKRPIEPNPPGCPGPSCNQCQCGKKYAPNSGCDKFCGEGAVCPGPTCNRCPCDDPSKIGPGSGGCWEWCGRDPEHPNDEPKPCTGDNCRCPGPNCDRVCPGAPTPKPCGCPGGECK